MSSGLGEPGSGAGKGGGGGGSIREAGGSFGKMEAAQEEEFFYKQVRIRLRSRFILIMVNNLFSIAKRAIEGFEKRINK